jgi:hypothetical protein
MRTATLIAASSFALAGLVAAAPVEQKRDIVYSTFTEEVWETLWSTTTVWVDPTATSVPGSVAGGFFEDPSSYASTTPTTTSSKAPVATSSVQAAAVPVSSFTSTSVYVAPPAPTSTSVYVAPAPTPTTTTAAPVVAASPAAAAPAVASSPASSGSSSSTTGTFTGDITYYSVEVGEGSCGSNGLDTDPLVALSHVDMANGANPNANPKCGKKINIYYNGAVHSATIFDTCPSCAEGSLDLTPSLFQAVAPNGDGRVHGVTWSYA